MSNREAASAVAAYNATGDAFVVRYNGTIPVEAEALNRILNRHKRADPDPSPGLYVVKFEIIRDVREHVTVVMVGNVELRKLRAEAAREMGLVD